MCLRRCFLVMLLMMPVVNPVFSAETQWWTSDLVSDFMSGEGEGVAIREEGVLEAVSTWHRALNFDEAVLSGAVEMPGGDILVLTGHPARLYRVHSASATLLAELPAEQGTGLLLDSEQTVWITTMGPGLLLRFEDGKLEEKGRLGEGGFWDLVSYQGSIILAAGPPAALFRLGERGLERWAEIPDDFVRCLAVDDQRLLAGSSGHGLIVTFSSKGKISLVADSPFTEISDIVVSPEGDVWAVALVGEPMQIKIDSAKASSKKKKEKNESSGLSLDLDLPKVKGKTAVSELLRLTPEGALLSVHRFPKQVAGSLALSGHEVLVGSGYDGEIWKFGTRGGARIAVLDAIQAVVMGAEGRFLLSQGPAALFERSEGEHRFRSVAKRFDRPVRFGHYRIEGSDGKVEIRFRSGAGSADKPIWLEWGPWFQADSGKTGLEFGRVLQWEIRLARGGSVDVIAVASREINLAPRFEGIMVEKPGLIYLASPPMGGPVISEDHPTFEGIFTTLGTPAEKSGIGQMGKKYWQKGYRTISWKVSDANGDPLLFNVELESEDGQRFPVGKDLKKTQLALDVGALPDGRYRCRVRASDEKANSGAALDSEGWSTWFAVDNTLPEIRMRWEGTEARIEVADVSPLLRVEVSEDGGKWRSLEPADGLLDSGREIFRYAPKAESGILLCRAFDTHHNQSAKALRK